MTYYALKLPIHCTFSSDNKKKQNLDLTRYILSTSAFTRTFSELNNSKRLQSSWEYWDEKKNSNSTVIRYRVRFSIWDFSIGFYMNSFLFEQ